ncbi:Ig-like domain-containing protein [Rhodohalobacter barkolensis]|uniref:Glycosyl hydrolase family 16 n=1 Tax=Rhodohalobacter barkolensis TaxID=2053187 RepID=A0A2N0VJ58_9BACT|nr:Ig-like domain-containing protein [Rhodohalobacter barkolensis]PKD44216.1 glycosyl hydrolase family 16 [Rhodohalobacter barkolensis]
MKFLELKSTQLTILAGLLLMFFAQGCERSVDGLEEPDFPANPEVFIDGFSAGLEYYPYEDSRQDAFSVDEDDTYDNSAASMRFDVPNVGDPAGAYAGAIFRDENGGRNLTSYNALTFYAKGTKAGSINDIGFGQDFLGDQYAVTRNDLKLTTNWEKYIIPIPDPSVLTSEQGLFWYAEGPEDGDGYSFWVDELQYENLPGLAQARPAILNGNEETQTSFIGSNTSVSGLTFTVNQANGVDVTVGAAPAYYSFSSSDQSVATVNEDGEVNVVGQGTAEITATLGDLNASGALIIESIGNFTPAPTPTEDPDDVISIFSDAYENVPVDFYNGFYEPFQTTTSSDFTVDGNDVLGYENFNFVGIEFNQNVPTIDGSDMNILSMDVFFPDEVPDNSTLRVTLRDFGADDSFGGGDDTEEATSASNPELESGEWITIELDISGMANKSNLGQIVLDSDLGPGLAGETIYVDNIYLRR